MKPLYCSIVVVCLSLLFFPTLASADLIDLNDFFKDPTVTVSPDGSSADFTEDAFLIAVLLSNDPGLGDTEVIFAEIGGVGQILSFDFAFSEPFEIPPNDDEFGAFIIDEFGFSAGAPFEFFTQVTSSGTVSFDLSSLSGTTLGMQFQLSSGFEDGSLTSALTVSNVELTPVPIPSAVLLAGLGLGTAAFSMFRKKRKLQK